MFRGRKIGTARRFGKTIFLIFCALAFGFITRPGSADTKSAVRASAKVKAETAIPFGLSENLPKGRRAYSITLDNNNAVSSSLSAGGRIDIAAAFPAGPDGLPLAVTVLRGVQVIEKKSIAGSTALILSVTAEDAERLAFAVANARIFISLCPSGPDTAALSQGVTFDDF